MMDPSEAKKETLSVIERYEPKDSSLIPILQACQKRFGYLPREVMEEISLYLNMPLSKIYGVTTFYAQFRLEPLGEHLVKVCHGTACHVRGADKINEILENELGIKSGDTTPCGTFSLERVACLGCCSLAPVIMVDETVHGNLDRDKLKKVISGYRGDGQ